MLITRGNSFEKLLSTKVLKSTASMDMNQSTEFSFLKPFITKIGTANTGKVGPYLDKAAIRVSSAAYNFMVALPGASSDPGDLAVTIGKDGTVKIEGVVKGATCPAIADVWYKEKMQEFPPSARFSTAFHLPGPVDPRLTSCSFKHGILDFTAMKLRLPPYFPNGNH